MPLPPWYQLPSPGGSGGLLSSGTPLLPAASPAGQAPTPLAQPAASPAQQGPMAFPVHIPPVPLASGGPAAVVPPGTSLAVPHMVQPTVLQAQRPNVLPPGMPLQWASLPSHVMLSQAQTLLHAAQDRKSVV